MNSLKIYSHPRSGTHFLEAILANNFYADQDLELKNIIWGHWSDRKVKEDPNPYGKLFGSHIFPSAITEIDQPSIYIYRDPRAVAYSIWQTPNFINPKIKDLSFSDFLRTKIDWIGSPAFRCRKKYTIITHWEKHVSGWLKFSEKTENLLVVRYEELKINPKRIIEEVSERFKLDKPKKIVEIDKPVGLLPNKAQIDSWKDVFNDKDINYIKKKIKSPFLKSIYF